MADLRISDAKHIEQITGNEKIPVSADGEAGYVKVGQIREITRKEFDDLDFLVDTLNKGLGNLEEDFKGVQPRLKGLYVSDVSNSGGSINVTQKSYWDGVETEKSIDFKTINGQSLFGQGDLKVNGGGGGESDVYVLPKELCDAMENSISQDGDWVVTQSNYYNELSEAIFNGKIIIMKVSTEFNESSYIMNIADVDLSSKKITLSFSCFNPLFRDKFTLQIIYVSISDTRVSTEMTISNFGVIIENTSGYSNPYSLSLTSPDTIQAGKQYFNEEEGKVYSKFEGFSPSNSTATILSSKPILSKAKISFCPNHSPKVTTSSIRLNICRPRTSSMCL